MTSTQLFILSMQTCQWWNAVFIQAKRFFDILESDHGGTPWDEGNSNSMFVAERMFLITALHHAIENLQKLNIELLYNLEIPFLGIYLDKITIPKIHVPLYS